MDGFAFLKQNILYVSVGTIISKIGYQGLLTT